MNDQVLADRLVKLLSDLIAIPSPYPPSDSVAICAYAADLLRKAGYQVEVRIGNSQAIRIPKILLDQTGISER